MDIGQRMSEPLVTFFDAPFAGRTRRFLLRLGEIEALEMVCRAGIGEIAQRLVMHTFKQCDIRETIRLGLQGGGLSEPESTAAVMAYFDEHPISPHVELASLIISAALAGCPPPKPIAEAPDGLATSATS